MTGHTVGMEYGMGRQTLYLCARVQGAANSMGYPGATQRTLDHSVLCDKHGLLAPCIEILSMQIPLGKITITPCSYNQISGILKDGCVWPVGNV